MEVISAVSAQKLYKTNNVWKNTGMKEIKSFAETCTLELYISQHLIFLKETKWIPGPPFWTVTLFCVSIYLKKENLPS